MKHIIIAPIVRGQLEQLAPSASSTISDCKLQRANDSVVLDLGRKRQELRRSSSAIGAASDTDEVQMDVTDERI